MLADKKKGLDISIKLHNVEQNNQLMNTVLKVLVIPLQTFGEVANKM